MNESSHVDEPRLELVDVGKVYRGGHRALEGITLPLGTGMLGLLGPNGAGKSTLMRIAATVTRPSEGQVRFNGTDVVHDPDVLRRNLGYLPQDFGVYPNLTAREFLAYLAAAKGLSVRSARRRIDDLLELVNLSQAAKRYLSGYSGGMLRRVGIAQALLGDPKVIIVLSRRREPLARLSDRERETLALMAEGRSNAGIADQLVVTEATVAKHIRNLFVKLELPPAAADHRRVLAVITYLQQGEG